jgi:hypothetical protein
MKGKYHLVSFGALIFLCVQLMGQGLENGAKHLGAGMAIGAIGGYTAHKLFQGDPNWTWAGAVGSSLAAGLAKETYDVSNGNEWQTDDVVFSALGGFLSGLVLDLLIKEKGGKGKERRGKGCGCLVVDSGRLYGTSLPMILPDINTGSRSISAGIQASIMVRKGL